MNKTAYRREIERAALEHRIEANLIEAIVIQESGGKTDAFRFEPEFYTRYIATNPKYVGQNPRRIASSYGLMQIMATTALEQHDFPYPDPEYLFIPAIGLEFGCRHFGMLMDWANGDVGKALAAYNGGKGNWKGVKPQAYAVNVKRIYAEVQVVRA